jgi:hypothetical protein
VWSEDTVYEKFPFELNGGTGSSQRVPRPTATDGNHWSTHTTTMFRYSERKLTYQSDTLNAMAGILNFVCTQLKSGHLEGLPTVCFDLSMLHWLNGNESER